ncbi:helix-turn-helix domain-containing protein [Thiobacillus sp.]|nr:helix-turn-helix domain-containing protein [Thiobacillus sp.]
MPAAERAHIQGLLDTHQGHRARVAAALGITERTLYRKLKQYGLGR